MILKNKVAVITGGSRGIGKAIAMLFAQEGAKIVIAARTMSVLKATAREIKQKNYPLLIVRTDVSNQKDVDNLVKQTIKNFGRIDILVNDAGILGPVGPLDKININKWITAVNINLIGTLFCIKKVIPGMIKQGSGKIINFSGGGAVYPRPQFSAYGTSKAAVVRLTETLAAELKKYNIQVNAIAPGCVATRLLQEVLRAGRLAGEKELRDAKRCLKSGGAPAEEAAQLALFLASSKSGALTGKLISAQWDDWKNFPKKIDQIMQTSLYSLRRIDGRQFKEVKQC